MKELALLITSRIAQKITNKVFWIHGSYIALKRGELKEYWMSVAISNDMNSNVKGKYLLNQRLSKTEVFGNPLMTISAAKHLAILEPAGMKWKDRLEKMDKDHCKKAYESYKKNITKEYYKIIASSN